jgi:hypothetical protein
MQKLFIVANTILLMMISSLSMADTLELADGTVIEGDLIGTSNGIVMFNTGDNVEAFPESEVLGIFLSAGVATAQRIEEEPVSPALVVPAGTRLVIRMVDSIDSKRHSAGHKFRGQLEGALVTEGVTVAPRGTFVYGTITAASQSGRMAGSSTLAMEFTDIMIDDQLYPFSTEGLAAQSSGEGGRTVGRTARAAVLGGLIDGSSGARTGAKVGLGASLLTSGSSLNVPAGTLLETNLRVPLQVTLN